MPDVKNSNEAKIRSLQVIRSNESVDNELPSILSMPDTWDAWRHERHYGSMLPLVTNHKDATWLTIGDSGADATWLQAQGVRHIIASSLTSARLISTQQRGFLRGVEVKSIDAQNIDLPDGAVDFAICKEAYHHFERPALGIYEMLRVSRQGIVLLCEPDGELGQYPLDKLKRALKIRLRRGTAAKDPEFEADGNFIFTLSIQELAKMATAIQTGPLYFSRMNDFWTPQIVYKSKSDKIAGAIMSSAIGFQNLLSSIKLMSWGKVTAILLKSEPSRSLQVEFKQCGLKRKNILVNPYL